MKRAIFATELAMKQGTDPTQAFATSSLTVLLPVVLSYPQIVTTLLAIHDDSIERFGPEKQSMVCRARENPSRSDASHRAQ